MRILILGGTLFLGRHIAVTAIERGHAVTVVNRGRTTIDVPARVTALRGDRDSDMEALRGRRFDVVIDTSAYRPAHVDRVAQSLADPGHYILVSTATVYSSFPATEESPVHAPLLDDGATPGPTTYAGLKRACEERARTAFGDRLTVVRPGVLVGPDDPTHRFEHWVRRCAHDGPMLAPGNPKRTIQVLDARDLAAWTLDIAGSTFGVFNVAGPAQPLTMEHLLACCIATTNSPAEPVWVSDDFLLSHDVVPWSELPLWIPDRAGPLLHLDWSRAQAAGLGPRPLSDTIGDVLQAPTQLRPLAGGMPSATPISVARERELLSAWEHGRNA